MVLPTSNEPSATERGDATMRFGFDIVSDVPLGVVAEWWRSCETGGIDVIGIPDSPIVCRETFVSAAACLRETESVRVMIAVSNPISRDLSVTGAALATLSELAPGRVVYGIGTGDSALWGVGLPSARVSRVREYVVGLKAFMRGRLR
jgi:5,10-methylenetetrahydromethanopterin reductase